MSDYKMREFERMAEAHGIDLSQDGPDSYGDELAEYCLRFFEYGAAWQAAQRQGGDDLQNAEREATELAWSLWRRRYREASPDFDLCDSVAGVITQINNMAAGLLEDLESAEAQLKQQAGEPVPHDDLIAAGEELKWAIISSPCLPTGWQDDRINDAIEAWHDLARQRPQPDWVPCSERLPTEADADCGDYGSQIGNVWYWSKGSKYAALKPWTWIYPISGDYWKPTGLMRPQSPEDV